MGDERKRSSNSVGGSRVISYDRNGWSIAPKDLNSRKGGRPNIVTTTRFTLLTWLPKSFFMQFQRAANIYFLFVSIIVMLPGAPIMWSSTVLPFCAVLLWTALKDMYEDIRRRRDDDSENLRKCYRFDIASRGFVEARWCDVLSGDILLGLQDEAFPADVLLVRATGGQAFISTVNLDGETNLKERRAADILSAMTADQVDQNVRRSVNKTEPNDVVGNDIKTEAAATASMLFEQSLEAQLDEPTSGLTDMAGSLQFNSATSAMTDKLKNLEVEQPCLLNYEHFVPRGCVLRNTAYVVSVAVYVGSESKTRLNVAQTGAKISNMQVYLNSAVQGLVATLLLFCFYASLSAELTDNAYWDRASNGGLEMHSDFLWKNFLYYWIILYQIVPISLYVCFEIIKLILGVQINRDPQMADPRTGKYALARTADLVEEMGQVNFVFSDKTGTLTENEMVFARCCIAGQDMGDFRADPAKKEEPAPGIVEVKRRLDKSEDMSQRAEVRWFFFCLVTCHSGQVDLDEENQPHFSGSSPDEVAFLEAGHSVGITFESRKRVAGSSSWEVHVRGVQEEPGHVFKVMVEIPFTSDRKRMTIVAQYKGEYFCIVKGADNVLLPLCDQSFDSRFVTQLTDYSKLGLRTLAIASKTVQRNFFEDWLKRYNVAMVSSEDREKVVASVAAEMEHSLTLSGISAIEDRLQVGVPEAIVTIKAAGIRFWVLTGDKTETAVEIVRACNLFTEEMALAYMVDCKDADHAWELLQAAQKMLEASSTPGGLILDGTFVKSVLSSDAHRKLLYQLAIASKACVCCRLSPQQKRKLVELVKEQNIRGITLAIGDGANDVSMIQGAHVGVGIRGKEGNQAVQASDVAISQFRFLVPLLLCHGRRAYRRVALFLCYMIYKHVTLAVADMIWAHQYKFNASIAYPEWLSAAFSPILTALPVIVVLAFDRDLPDAVVNSTPELYMEGIERVYFNMPIFAGWILSAIWHGTLSWVAGSWLAAEWNYDPEVYSNEFWFGSCVGFVLAVICVNMRLWMVALNPFSKATVLVLALSFSALIVCIFMLGETFFCQLLQPQIEGVPTKMFSESKYLSIIFLAPLLLLIDFFVYQVFFYVFPKPLDRARRQWRALGRPAEGRLNLSLEKVGDAAGAGKQEPAK